MLYRLLIWSLGFLGQLLVVFIKEVKRLRLDNQDFLVYLQGVEQAMEQHPEWDSDQKRTYVGQAVTDYAVQLGVDVKDAAYNVTANGLLEIALNHLRGGGKL